MRMQQKQVTKKAAVARKVKGRRGVTILCLAGFFLKLSFFKH